MIRTTALRRFLMATAASLIAAVSALTQDEKSPQKPFVEEYVRAAMSAPPASLAVDLFYKKYTDALGIAILSSEKVPDAALLVARDIVIHMAYKEAMTKGLWKNHYASTNANEYWAEGTQTWFCSNYEYIDGDTRVQTPEDLQRYDPKLYALLGRVYEDHHIPLDIYYGKNIRPARSRR